MRTEIIYIDKDNIDKVMLGRAAAIIRAGGLVAFPTETVYGIGANALDSEAAKKIYVAKGRPSDNPLILHISDINDICLYAKEIPDKAWMLATEYWPGPLTVVLKKRDIVPYETTGGLDTVAIRMPSHPVARNLIKLSRLPIAAPSANISGKPSPTKASHVYTDMNNRIDMIIDGGMASVGLESTILDCSGDMPTILRSGAISRSMLESVVGEVALDEAVCSECDAQLKPKAPGMKYRHYAPNANLTIVEGESSAVTAKINELTAAALAAGRKVGIISSKENAGFYIGGEIVIIGSREDEKAIALNLFDVLRSFDDMGVDMIYSESFEGAGLREAIMNRLVKAAAYKVIRCNYSAVQKNITDYECKAK